MPTFAFDDNPTVSTSSGSSASITFTEDGVSFTLSTSGNGGFNAVTDGAGAGPLSITDSSTNAPFSLVINDTPSSNFGNDGGNIALQLGSFLSGAWNVTFVNAGTGADQQFTNVAANQLLSFATSDDFSAIRFTPTGTGNFIQVNSLTASITCYLAGTQIATPTGAVAVETLQSGDEILTAGGGTTTVRWLGVQPIDARTATPAKANPICFVAGALAPNVPSSDLFVSPDHAMEIDGLLYNASALVNGRSVYQVAAMPMDGFTYYHIDTGSHELILAEGAASETYLDAVGRDAFINGHEQADAPIIKEMSVPRIVAKRMVPQHVVDTLAARADELGLSIGRKVA